MYDTPHKPPDFCTRRIPGGLEWLLLRNFSTGKNRLLAAVPRRQHDRLLRHLEPVPLQFEEILYEPDQPIRHVYFPTSGMISLLLKLDDGSVPRWAGSATRG